MTTILNGKTIDGPTTSLVVLDGVYAPQADSELLVGALHDSGRAEGARAADLCSGSGIVALAAAAGGAASVDAFEASRKAVTCARANAAGVAVRVHHGSWTRAIDFDPFDVVTCNPPYVPHAPDADDELPEAAGPRMAWNAGPDGRRVLDPLCRNVSRLIARGGTILIVQSSSPTSGGQSASCAAPVWTPQSSRSGGFRLAQFCGARARWLERTGLLERGRREERIAVVRADRSSTGTSWHLGARPHRRNLP